MFFYNCGPCCCLRYPFNLSTYEQRVQCVYCNMSYYYIIMHTQIVQTCSFYRIYTRNNTYYIHYTPYYFSFFLSRRLRYVSYYLVIIIIIIIIINVIVIIFQQYCYVFCSEPDKIFYSCSIHLMLYR